MKSTYGKMTYA